MKSSIRALLGTATAAVLFALPTSLQAQAFPGNMGVTADNVCTLDIFAVITPTKCAGFYSGNSLSGSLDADGVDALTKMGILPAPVAGQVFIEKADSWNGTASFATTMYGQTVIAMHWGNYAEGSHPAGNVTAFFLFDAGTTGIKDFDLKSPYTGGISNAAIVRTGDAPCVGCTNTVPEPSSYALMAAGLAALGFVAMRRRNNA